MFAQRIAEARTKAAASVNGKPGLRRSTFGGGRIEQGQMPPLGIGNKAALHLLAQRTANLAGNEPGGDREPMTAPVPAGAFRHDVGRNAVGAEPHTRNPNGTVTEDEIRTADGGVPPTPAPTPAPAPAPSPAPAAARKCEVTAGPSYTPTGSIPVTTTGHAKKAHFDMSAKFANDAAAGKVPGCGEVRQFIKWDTAFHTWNHGPPNSSFPATAAADTWIEDRGTDTSRYGRRTGPFSIPTAGCGDEYKTGATRDMANGDTYCGNDHPGGPDTMVGQFQFQLKAVDTCNGDAEKASSAVITVPWAAPTPAAPAPAPAPAPPGHAP